MNNPKKIIFFIVALLLAIPPFFDGGNNIFIKGMVFIFPALALVLFASSNFIGWKIIKEKLRQPVFLFLAGFFIFGLISILFSTSTYKSAIVWLEYLNYAILFLIVAFFRWEKREIDFLIKVFLAVSSTLCLIGIYFYLTGSYARLTSTFYWPNPFAGYLLFSLFLGLDWLFKGQKEGISCHCEEPAAGDEAISVSATTEIAALRRGGFARNDIKKILFLSIIFGSFLLSASRGAFLAAFLGFSFWLVIDFKKIKKYFFSLLFIISISLAAVLLFGYAKNEEVIFLNRGEKTENNLDVSSNIRLNYWQGSWEIFKDYPVFGSGLGTFATVYKIYQKDPVSSGKYAHNLYLEILAEAGPIVMTCFILFLFFLFKDNFKKIGEKKYALPLFIGLLSFLIHNGVDVDWHFAADALTFWVFLGLFYNISREDDLPLLAKERDGVRWGCATPPPLILPLSKGERVGGALIILSLILLTAGLILISSNYNFKKGMEAQDSGNLFLAEKYFKKSIFLNPSPDYFRQIGIIKYTLGLRDENIKDEYLGDALEYAQKAVKFDINNSANYELRGRIYYAQGKTKEAKDDFKESIKLNKLNQPSHYINLALLLIGEERYIEARDFINEILAYYPPEVVNTKKMYILKDQQETTGIAKEILYLEELLKFIKVNL